MRYLMTACGLDVKVGKPYMRAVIETPWSSLTLLFHSAKLYSKISTQLYLYKPSYWLSVVGIHLCLRMSFLRIGKGDLNSWMYCMKLYYTYIKSRITKGTPKLHPLGQPVSHREGFYLIRW